MSKYVPPWILEDNNIVLINQNLMLAASDLLDVCIEILKGYPNKSLEDETVVKLIKAVSKAKGHKLGKDELDYLKSFSQKDKQNGY